MNKITYCLLDHSRKLRKRIKTDGTLNDLISEARKNGFEGDRIVIAQDGFEIIDNEDLLENIGNQLMILSKYQDWVHQNDQSKSAKQLSLGQQSEQQIQVMYQEPIEQQSNAQHSSRQYIYLGDDSYELPLINDVNMHPLGNSENDITIKTVETLKTCPSTTPKKLENEWDALLEEEASPGSVSVSDAEKFKRFEIPWDKVNTDLMNDIRRKKKLLPRELCDISKTFVAELRTINPRIPKSVMEKIARGAAGVYPDSFLQGDEAEQADPLPNAFLQKMIRNRNYRNRPTNPPAHTIQSIHRKAQEIRACNKIAETVIGYQPNIVGQEAALAAKRTWLKEIFGTPQAKENSEQIHSDMIETYGLQRLDINKMTSVVDIFNAWPYLKDDTYLKQHFHSLTGVKLSNFLFFFERYKDAVINHLESSNIGRIKKMLPEIRDLHTDLRAIKLLTGFFNENYEEIIVNFKIGTSVEEMVIESKLLTPFVAVVDNTDDVFHVFVDGHHVTTTTSVIEAVMLMFGMYYIFNILYPKGASLTLEFLQRQILRVRASKPRGKKTSASAMASVTGLMVAVHNSYEDEENNT